MRNSKSQQTIELARVKLTAAERELRRAEESMQNNAISEVDYERAKDELSRAKVEHAHAVQDSHLDAESLEFETTISSDCARHCSLNRAIHSPNYLMSNRNLMPRNYAN